MNEEIIKKECETMINVFERVNALRKLGFNAWFDVLNREIVLDRPSPYDIENMTFVNELS